jgi:hypothetical protein
MKKIIVAGLIAIGCMTMTAAPSMAQGGPIIISERGHHSERDRFERRHHREMRRHERVRHFRGERCRTKVVKYRHHGRLIVEKRTFCR